MRINYTLSLPAISSFSSLHHFVTSSFRHFVTSLFRHLVISSLHYSVIPSLLYFATCSFFLFPLHSFSKHGSVSNSHIYAVCLFVCFSKSVSAGMEVNAGKD